jgi:NAD(P)-dependent dehydrogenase (short-subunit alcohol dehydrogenase family)
MNMKVLDSFRLNGKVAVMSGGAGLYGRQIAAALAEAGAKTFIAARNVEKLEAEAVKLRSAGGDVTALQFDQADESSCQRLLDQVLNSAGRVDVLVNNAVARPMKDWADPAEAWAESMRVNATGLFMVTRCFANQMVAQGGGSIINVGSMQGMVGPDFTLYEGLPWNAPPDYFFHKGGLIQLTRYVASKFGHQGVRCNAISPGGFFSGQDPTFLERYYQRTLLGRMANDTDLKGVIVFLASDASVYITGANIPVDGGYTAK